MMRFLKAAGAVVLLFVLGCGSSGHALRGGKPPKWAVRAPGAWKCKVDGRVGFCSLGMIGHVVDPAMRRTAAAQRAKAELVQFLDTYVASLYKDYQAATTNMKDAAEEQHVQRAIKTFSAGHISGVEMVDYWEDEKGTAFALGFLSLKDFKDLIDKIKELNQQARQAIVHRAEEAFKELRLEEERRGAK